jgi:hypothetical protein
MDDGQVTALTGAGALGKGSRLHDVASLAVHALLWDGEPAALDELLRYAADHACPGEFEVSLAARLLTVLARGVTHSPENASQLIGQAAAALARLDLVGSELTGSGRCEDDPATPGRRRAAGCSPC